MMISLCGCNVCGGVDVSMDGGGGVGVDVGVDVGGGVGVAQECAVHTQSILPHPS